MQYATLVVVLVGFAVVVDMVHTFERNTMGQIEDLKSGISQLGVDLGEAVVRVEAAIAKGGEPDADLSAEITKLKELSVGLDALAATPVAPEPTPEPEPTPVPDPGTVSNPNAV